MTEPSASSEPWRDHQGVVGLQDGHAVRSDDSDDRALNVGQLFERLNAGQTEMVTLADVRDDGDVAAVIAQAFAEDAAAGRLEHGRVDLGIEQDGPRALGAAAVPGLGAPAADVDAFRVQVMPTARPVGGEDGGDRRTWWSSSCRSPR